MNTQKLEHIAIEARKLQRDIIKLKSEVDCDENNRRLHDYLRSAEQAADLLSYWSGAATREALSENTINK